MKTVRLKVDYLTRVEGEGALHVRIREGMVQEVQLRIFEPPRFFESFLRGRRFSEVPDLTARICGICPIAYQMSAVHALENAFGMRITGPLRALRRLVYCGEWIESHALSVYMLHAPDFLGYSGAIEMAGTHTDAVKRGLRLKKAGNEILALLGGREIHPINVRVGGFYKIPSRRDLAQLGENLKWAREAALETVRWVAAFAFPEAERDYEFVALSHPDEYPMNEGKLVSNKGLDIDVALYESHVAEEHIEYTTALHSVLRERGEYFVGPLARYNLNFDRLSPLAREAAEAAGIRPPCRNPFKSITVRAVEILNACDEAIRIIDNYEQPDSPVVEVPVREGAGIACTEAPRGILYHRYGTDSQGNILDARIIPPTSQNQKSIEEDLRQFIPARVQLGKEKLTAFCEHAIRNYDPCISCSTHCIVLND
ncbi:MAG: Ni/Fe hydrogenase subunit alpha [Acidobacteria bacterium]|nr:Ni/Fe hydrogenase subunit alpha [Acidobacteriota bacterium]